MLGHYYGTLLSIHRHSIANKKDIWINVYTYLKLVHKPHDKS